MVRRVQRLFQLQAPDFNGEELLSDSGHADEKDMSPGS